MNDRRDGCQLPNRDRANGPDKRNDHLTGRGTGTHEHRDIRPEEGSEQSSTTRNRENLTVTPEKRRVTNHTILTRRLVPQSGSVILGIVREERVGSHRDRSDSDPREGEGDRTEVGDGERGGNENGMMSRHVTSAARVV